MTNEEIKQAWDEALSRNGGELLRQGMGGDGNMTCLWNGFMMAHGRPDLFGYANYMFITNTDENQIWERKNVRVGER